MTIQPTIKRLSIIIIFLFVGYSTTVNAEILFNGDWANYIGSFYGPNGWQNGTPTGEPTSESNWSDFSGYWTPKPIPNTWLFNTSSANNRIQLVQDVTSPKGGMVARFEVRSGDHRPDHWSGERAEMYSMIGANGKKLPVTEESGHEYYAISVKVSEDWVGPQPETAAKGHAKWGSFMQLHSPNVYNSPPALDLSVEDEFGLYLNSGELVNLIPDKKSGLIKQTKKNSQYFQLTNGALNKGHWIQFVLDVIWKKDATGAVKLYRRDEGQIFFQQVLSIQDIPTLQYSQHISTDPKDCSACGADNTAHYWRVGYYRSTSNQTNVLWLGPIVRASSFCEASISAFGDKCIQAP